MISFKFVTIYPLAKSPRYPLERRLGGLRAGLDAAAVQSLVHRYTD
jgi:hypothetical protein